MKLEKGLEDKENEAPAKKRSRVGARKEDQSASLAFKEGELLLESNKQAGDPVGQECTATEEIVKVHLNVPREESVHGEGGGKMEEMNNPEAVMVEIEFGGEVMDDPIETVATRDLPSTFPNR